MLVEHDGGGGGGTRVSVGTQGVSHAYRWPNKFIFLLSKTTILSFVTIKETAI